MQIPFERSFASHKKHIFWSKNNKKQPREVFKSTASKYLFDCNLCGHEFQNSLCYITNGTWCPYCSHRQLCNNENCKLCFNKSFSSNPKKIFWSSKNLKQPREVFKSSGSICLFDCEKCGHEFEKRLADITDGCWCPYCVNQKLCDKEDCKTCFNKSFSSSDKCIFLSSKNEKIPREVFKSTVSKYIFNCEKGHEFESSLNSVSSGYWCPSCKNKTETKLYEKMIPLFPSIRRQFGVKILHIYLLIFVSLNIK